MNGDQAHLLVNHAPLFAAAFGGALGAAGHFLGKEDLKRAGLWAMTAAACAAGAAYLTGEGAEKAVEHLPGVAKAAIHAHEEAAEKALSVVLLGGAWAGIVLIRGRSRDATRAETLAVLAAAAASFLLLAWTSHLGGLIRRPDLVP